MRKALMFVLCLVTAVTLSSQGSMLSGSVPDFLDYGFYWVKADTSVTKAIDENSNAIPVGSEYYDPSKPVLVYFHGWQKGSSVENYSRETFQWIDSENNINQNTILSWKNAGWNVLIFYWNQFADEDEVKDAEAKIWSINGPGGMRYRLKDGSYSTNQSPQYSLRDIAFDQYVTLVYDNTSSIKRFAGHSLGNQLAVSVAKTISDYVNINVLPEKMMPERIELLDPFWSSGSKSYLNGKWTGEEVKTYVQTMISRHNTAVTWYRTSAILDLWIGDRNTELTKMVAYVHPAYWYYAGTQLDKKHIAARHSYFWSHAFDPPVECTINWWNRRRATGNVGASAATSTARIRQMMDPNREWVQVEGRYTPTPGDDWQEVKSR